MKISPARTAAYDILLKIEKEKAFSSVLLPAYEENLSASDRGLCHEFVLGVVRRQMLLDRYIDELVDERKLDIDVRVILRLGLFQLIRLDRVPSHAAVDESVKLTVRAKKTSAKGLVNAVLRKASRGLSQLHFVDELERASVETSHPRWLLERWTEQFGRTSAVELAQANNQPAPLTFRRTPIGGELDLGRRYQQSQLVPGCFIADSYDSDLRELANGNKIYFQDEVSQMVAQAVPVPLKKSKVLDVCASPGGKTTLIAAAAVERARSQEAILIFAGDRTRRRTELLRKTCIDQDQAFINVLQYDATVELPFVESTFDSVLVDAPCSGTGTIRHNPEIRYFVEPSDFRAFQETQLVILKNASKHVKSGGTLLYSTCSLECEENEEVCRSFLLDNTEFELQKPIVPAEFVTGDGFARTYPHRDRIDGFFIAAFVRK